MSGAGAFADLVPGDDDAARRALPLIDGLERSDAAAAAQSRRTGKTVTADQVVSPAGAVGRYQIMPATAAQFGIDPATLTDPNVNRSAAETILADLGARFGRDPATMAVGYNGGPGRAQQFLAAGKNPAVLPAETQDYYSRALDLIRSGAGSIGSAIIPAARADTAPADPFSDLVPAAKSAAAPDPFSDLVPAAPRNDGHWHNTPQENADLDAFEAIGKPGILDHIKSMFSGDAPLPQQGKPEDSLGSSLAKVIQNFPDAIKHATGGLIESSGTGPYQSLTDAELVREGATPEQTAQIRQKRDAALKRVRQGKEIAAVAAQHIKENAPNIPENSAKQYAYDISNGLAQFIPLAIASGVTKSPAPMLSGFALTSYGDKYAESRTAGRSPEQADSDAMFSAAANAIPAMLPLHALMKPGQKFLGKVLQNMGAGVVQNELTSALQMGYDTGVLHKDMTWGEAAKELVHQGIVGLGFGAVMGIGGGAKDRVTSMGDKSSPPADTRVEPAPAGTSPAPPEAGAPVEPAAAAPIPPRQENGPAPAAAVIADQPSADAEALNREFPKIPDAAPPPAPVPALEPVHDPVTWAQTGWKDQQGNILPLDQQPGGEPELVQPVDVPDQGVKPPVDQSAPAQPETSPPVATTAAPDAGAKPLVAPITAPEAASSVAPPAPKPGIMARLKAKLAGKPAAPAYDFRSTFPEPQDAALRKAGRNGFYDEAGTGQQDGEALRAFHEEAENQIASSVHGLEIANQALKTGADPATGKAPKPKDAAAFQQKWTDEAAMARRDFADHLGSYQDYFGPAATDAFREHLLQNYDETGTMRGGDQGIVNGDKSTGKGEVPPENGMVITPDQAKAALVSNIDPATGKRPKGNAALRDFRARMQKSAAETVDVSHETEVPPGQAERMAPIEPGAPLNPADAAGRARNAAKPKDLAGAERIGEDVAEPTRDDLVQMEADRAEEEADAEPDFDPKGHLDQMRALVADRSKPLTNAAVAKHLKLEPDQAARVVSALVAQPDSGVMLTQKGLRRRAISEGPEHVAEFLAARGGIRDDEGHDLIRGRGLQQMVPGHGPLIRKTGMSIDAAGERLHEAGFFGPPRSVSRPPENDVLQLIEGTRRGANNKPTKVFAPTDQAAHDEAQLASRNQEANDDARQEVHDTARGMGETLTDDEADQIAANMGHHAIDAESAVAEHIERKAMQEVYSDHDQTGDQAYGEDIPFPGDEGEADQAARPGREGRPAGPEDQDGAPAAREPASADSGKAPEVKTEKDAEGLDQGILSHGDHSARQLAAAREAGGRGKIRPKAPQKNAGGMFAEPEQAAPDMFARGDEPMFARRDNPSFDWKPGGGSKTKKIGDTEITYGVGKDHTAELTLVRTVKGKRNAGSARSAIEKFLSEADQNGYRVHLTADPMEKGTSKPRLEGFYKSLGFKRNAGRTRDFSTRAGMIREPKGEPVDFARRGEAAPFFSALTRGVEGMKQERAPAQQWAGMIDNLPGVKKEEVDWSGVKDWLASRDGPVSKSDLIQHLRENEVQLQEVKHGRLREDTPPDQIAKDEHGAEFERLNAEIRRTEDMRNKTRRDPRYETQYRKALEEDTRLRDQRESLHDRMVDETVARSGDSGKPTKYGTRVLPGGENYREFLLTTPKVEELPENATRRRELNAEMDRIGHDWYDVTRAKNDPANGDRFHDLDERRKAIEARQDAINQELNDLDNKRVNQSSLNFNSNHWQEPNILAHVRFDDRTGSNGEKVLHLAEVQSDWHQAGRRRGYAMDDSERSKLKQRAEELLQEGHKAKAEGREVPDEKKQEWAEAMNRLRADNNAVPDAPFKSSWHELAMKRMLRYAAENGYDKVTWDTGETQADRYDLSKQVDAVSARRTQNGTFDVSLKQDGEWQSDPRMVNLKPESLAEFIGKDLAEKITKEVTGVDQTKEYTGIDLKVGGDGMKGFYDKILPAFLNKYGKKWGARVEHGSIPGAGEETGIAILPDGSRRTFTTMGEAARWVAQSEEAPTGTRIATESERSAAPVHSIDITPAMREGVMQGQPMFAARTKVKGGPGGRVKFGYTEKFDAKRAELEPLMRAELDRHGLKDVTLELPDSIREVGRDGAALDGVYLQKTIAAALDAPEEGRNGTTKNIVHHEVFHAIRRLGLLRDAEWSALAGKANKWAERYGIDDRYKGIEGDKRIEEAAAHAYSDYAAGRLHPEGNTIKRIFRRIAGFFEAVRNAFHGAGFKTADDVFQSLPEIGHRGLDDGAGATDEGVAFARRRKKGEDEPKPVPPGIVTRVLGEHAEALGRRISDTAARLFPESVREAADAVQMAITPMARGSDAARATAKDFANAMRKSRVITGRQMEYLAKTFEPDQLKRMWEAADEQSVAMQEGRSTKGIGLDRLTKPERDAVEAYQAESNVILKQAKDIGLFKGEGLPSYVPRMVVALGADGKFGRLQSKDAPETAHGLDAIGRNVKTTSANLKQRKYLTAAETEEAAQGINAGAVVVKDFRTLPLAMGRLQDAIAGRTLINRIRDIGRDTGEITVSEGAEPNSKEHGGWFTIDHPAFKTYRPKFFHNEETGKTETLLDQNNEPILERVPLFIRRDFEGPLRAVLSKDTSGIYQAAMTLKGKGMAIIMYSPLMHNAVIWGKAFPAAPIKLLKPMWRGADGKLHLSLEMYGRGREAKNNPVTMKEALDNGLDPVGHRYFNQDASAIMEEPSLKPGRSWTAQALAYVPGLFDKGAGDAVKRAVDKAGDVWHNKFLWDLVGDLQMGLYTHMRDNAIKAGSDPQSAGRMAAHFANRYAGALPIESMSKIARQTANMMLFSRSFTLTNLGAFKDVVAGLPKDVQSQILRDKGIDALNRIQGQARRKAVALLGMDIFLSHVGLFMAQYALAYAAGRAFTSPSQNEPDKENRFLIGYQKDGTAIYGRLPTGKVGEELQDWVTEPVALANRKLSPYGRLMYAIAANDQGFGHKVYDPHDASALGYAKNIGRIVKFAAETVAPLSPFQSMFDLAKGKGEAETNYMKIILPLLGVTVSKGAPGGPAVGQLYNSKDEHEFQVGEAMPDIRAKIASGDPKDLAAAEAAMTRLGMSKSYQSYVEKTTRNPGSRLSKKQMREFQGFATPDEKSRMQGFMDRAQDQGEADPDQHSEADPKALQRALQGGTLEKFASAGQSWTRQDAVRAASRAGMPATAALLREAKDPFRSDLRQKLLGESAAG